MIIAPPEHKPNLYIGIAELAIFISITIFILPAAFSEISCYPNCIGPNPSTPWGAFQIVIPIIFIATAILLGPSIIMTIVELLYPPTEPFAEFWKRIENE